MRRAASTSWRLKRLMLCSPRAGGWVGGWMGGWVGWVAWRASSWLGWACVVAVVSLSSASRCTIPPSTAVQQPDGWAGKAQRWSPSSVLPPPGRQLPSPPARAPALPCRRSRRLISLAFRFLHPQEWPWFWWDFLTRAAQAAAAWVLAAWAALLAACAHLWAPFVQLRRRCSSGAVQWAPQRWRRGPRQ